MIAQCWLHIGTEKTGSTSIQTFLAENRVALRARGWLYSEAAGNLNHYKLVAYSLDEERDDTISRALGIPQRIAVEDFRRELAKSLAAEAAASDAGGLVLSNELLATRLSQPEEIARLRALCGELARNTKVVVYLRNQADFLVSRYTNVIWEGGTEEFDYRARIALGDYARLLERWANIFGRENIVARRFEPAEFPDGNVLDDFCGAIGLDMEGLHLPPRTNPSLDAESLAFLRGLNRRLSPRMAERLRPLRGRIVRVLQRRRGGTRFAVPRTLAAEIEGGYRASNERVAANWFGSRHQPLFSPPVLVWDDGKAPPVGNSALTTIRISGWLAQGLLRDVIIWAARRLLRRA